MRNFVLLVFCLPMIATVGCGGSDTIKNAFAKASEHNIQKCCAMYAIYSTLNDFKGPNSKEEMLAFLSVDENARIRLERMSMDPAKLDSYLTGRDGEPLEFRWGVNTDPATFTPAYVVCWEKVGMEGVVQVGVTGGTIVETSDEDELNELKKGVYSGTAEYGQFYDQKEHDEP